ncbi:hypothetical protein [Streptomyces sp. JJ36]|nr:hypothetical protein [Streptomyces sp. JJ36]MCF6526208.1 hypothetical protein [Streptomyces sp. JJ36]
MGEHVHVRLRDGLGVSEDGELVEHSRCRCGARWTERHPVADGRPEE